VCREDEACESGRCQLTGVEGFCTAPCTGPQDCPADLRCSAGPSVDGRQCEPACEQSFDFGFVCVDGALVTCEEAGEAWTCFDCGCPADQFCDGVCRPDGGVGAVCTWDEQCESNHCAAAGFCQVPAGAVCTAETCESCDRRPGGSSCAQTCNGNDCDDDEACIGSRELERYYCRTGCDPADLDSCPYGWRCDYLDLIAGPRWMCSPSPTCEPGVSGCRNSEDCVPLAGTSYSICAPFCSVFDPGCPAGWSCDTSAGACVPQPH
jgi:hypothetical protein